MNDAEKPDSDPISLVSDAICGPVVAYKSVVFPINLIKIGYNAFKWQILPHSVDLEDPALLKIWLDSACKMDHRVVLLSKW